MYRESFIILYSEPTNTQLIDKLLCCSCVFQHHCVILRELVVNTLLSYISVSMQLLVIQLCYCIVLLYYQQLHWHTYVTQQGTNYKLPEDDTMVLKYVGAA